MRGTLTEGLTANEKLGLIPTYAGNTSKQWCARRVAGAHPHVCGEHFLVLKEQNDTWGSSPRMRGTRFNRFFQPGLEGLIPTYAGNT